MTTENKEEHKIVKVPYSSTIRLPIIWYTQEPIYDRYHHVKDYKYELYRDDLALEVSDRVFLATIYDYAWWQLKKVVPDCATKFQWSTHSDYSAFHRSSTRFETDGQYGVIRNISGGYTDVQRLDKLGIVLTWKVLPAPSVKNTPSMTKK